MIGGNINPGDLAVCRPPSNKTRLVRCGDGRTQAPVRAAEIGDSEGVAIVIGDAQFGDLRVALQHGEESFVQLGRQLAAQGGTAFEDRKSRFQRLHQLLLLDGDLGAQVVE